MHSLSPRRPLIRPRHLIAGGFLLTSAIALSACIKKGAPGANTAEKDPESQEGNGWCMEKTDLGKGCNKLGASDFEDGAYAPWATSFTAPGDGNAEIKDGALCTTVLNKGKERWDAQLRHRVPIEAGHTYYVEFEIWSDKDTKVFSKIGMSGKPYHEYWTQKEIKIGPNKKKVSGRFVPRTGSGFFDMVSATDPGAEFAFHFGGYGFATAKTPYTVCIDNVKLLDPSFEGLKKSKEEVAKVRVNQVAYLPGLSKTATYVTKEKAPLDFKIVDPSGKEVFRGKTIPFGPDPDSGDDVHVVDFTALKQQGSGYVLKIGKDESVPFDVGGTAYQTMRYDALRYFYYNRSGIEIKMPYAKDPKYAHPAGHKPDMAKCYPGSPGIPAAGCDYELDVTGGWYDAGDYGKYVVNGGISTWTLFHMYERMKHLAPTTLGDYGDGKMNIPESGNGTPDLLDEARWEMEFMLKMQVPDGKPKAGMAHHKVHDDKWTAIPLAPQDSKVPRSIHKATTAATLNLAATAAQCARVFKEFDAAFATKCLTAAEKAYAAAKKNPSIFADKKSVGGGPYDDKNVADEFYWAAAELYLATGKDQYLQECKKSPFWSKLQGQSGEGATSFTWGSTAALGTISLATVKGSLAEEDLKVQRDLIVNVASGYVDIISKQGHRTPFASGKDGYPWGSNSFVTNNMMVMILAHDFTKDDKYANGVAEGIGYILGRNGLAKSYVTGYGEKPLENPHHRFWAHATDPSYPPAPPGAVSGGPNSAIQDSTARAAGLEGCKPQKCFVDNIDSWSTNEITINWNGPFAYVVGYLVELQAQGK